ncbi:hypothetical protein AB0C84_20215 [Actinomadura sp. NPDC048955]|uniref:hypothetical protein n=1 Tax=Actinomadura sp. NPDC048955 TaxID=3158228 RepID=UPI0033D71436
MKNDVSAATVRYAKTIITAILITALNDQVTCTFPCYGVRPHRPEKPLGIISSEQFDGHYHARRMLTRTPGRNRL